MGPSGIFYWTKSFLILYSIMSKCNFHTLFLGTTAIEIFGSSILRLRARLLQITFTTTRPTFLLRYLWNLRVRRNEVGKMFEPSWGTFLVQAPDLPTSTTTKTEAAAAGAWWRSIRRWWTYTSAPSHSSIAPSKASQKNSRLAFFPQGQQFVSLSSKVNMIAKASERFFFFLLFVKLSVYPFGLDILW